jgi:N-acetylglutamate synthase-like GNAT family acetyltransferase
MDASGSLAGIVFRRLDAEADLREAARMLPECHLVDHDRTCVWYGLCDLTAAEGSGLAGVALVRVVEPTTARLCALAVSGGSRAGRLGRRLVCDVADRLRASGVETLVAAPVNDSSVAPLLVQLGFVALERPQAGDPGWSWLAL